MNANPSKTDFLHAQLLDEASHLDEKLDYAKARKRHDFWKKHERGREVWDVRTVDPSLFGPEQP
jgi:hypothetical protein